MPSGKKTTDKQAAAARRARKPAASGRNPRPDPSLTALAKKEVDHFRHQFHLVEAELGRLQKDIAIADSRDAETVADLQRKLAAAQKLIAGMRDEAARAPQLAAILGLETPRPEPVEPVIPSIVAETQIPVKDIDLEVPTGIAQPRLTGIGMRDPLKLDGDTLKPVKMVGKLRMQFGGEDGRPAPNAPYALHATLKGSDAPLQLRSGRTDSKGYTSVNLSDIEVERLEKLDVLVYGAAGAQPFRYSLGHDILVNRPGILAPHFIPVPKDLIDKFEEWLSNQDGPETPGTIEDPDDVDVTVSPESFGLNEEHVDGNCCLRPRTEFPAKEYYFRQTVRLTDIEDVRLVFNGEKPVQRSGVKAPIDFQDQSESTYAVLGGNLLVGLSNLYRHAWYPAGRGLGRLLYSTSLAPCEEVNLAFIDWTRSERDTRTESRTQSERMEHDLQHDRSIDEVVDSVLRERQTGRSSSGGGGASLDLGFFSIGGGGGSTSSTTTGRRSLHASTVQDISDTVSQSASSLRHQRATVVTTSFQRESERIQTRTVHNHNMNHIMNLQYFQVVEHYSVKTELVEEKPVLLVPYAIDDAVFDDIPSFDKFVLAPSRPITRFLDRHSRVLRYMVPRRLRSAFSALSRLLHCHDVYAIEEPYATFSRWDISLSSAWRPGVSIRVQTKSGQSVRLSPRGHSSSRPPTSFVSSPVRHDDIDQFVVSFDAAEAVRNLVVPNVPFANMIEDALADSIKYTLEQIEVFATTDRSRYVSQPQSFVIETNGVSVTLDASNPSVNIGVTADPLVDFSSYRGREHEDYCRLKELIAYIQGEPMRFMRAIWLREDPDRRAIRFDQYKIGDKSLLDHIVNRPVGILGNYVAFELLEGYRIAPVANPDYVISSRVVTIPTRGVFGEVYLSCCNATEKRDIERFVEPENRCQRKAPDITGVTPGSRASRSDTTPTDFAAPMVNIQSAPPVPDPSGMANALSVMGTPDIFRDLSRGAELLSFINNATKEAFTSTRQHRAAMDAIAGDVIRGLVSAYTGVPIGSSGTPGAASSGTTGITPTEDKEGGAKPDLKVPTSAKVNDPGLQALASELVRQAEPTKLVDQMQTIKKGVDSGLLTETQGQQLTNSLLGGVEDQSLIIPASALDYGVVAQPLGTASRKVDIKLRVFIPSPAVSLGIGDAFAGDDRSFAYSGGTSRAEIHASLTFGTDHPWPVLEIHDIAFGTTHAYDSGDVSDVPGKPSWWKAINAGATPKASDTLARTVDNLNIVQSHVMPPTAESYWPKGPIAALAYLKVNGPNPLVAAAPAINADLYLYVKEYNGKLWFKLTGSHDGFPAYELYVDQCLVLSHDPEATNQGPLSLFPPSEFSVGQAGITHGWAELPCETV
ncbi:MAG: hypothetical protein D6758_09055 [Gammaproteobacteria bacterium]|nr:MAG: hypothetical protein D6758_09055 [Gammaproteobacteria bacterium]